MDPLTKRTGFLLEDGTIDLWKVGRSSSRTNTSPPPKSISTSRRTTMLREDDGDGADDDDRGSGRIFLPQHFHLDHIHQAYPNATWILNRREPVTEWADSVIGHNQLKEDLRLDLQFANEYYAHYHNHNHNRNNHNHKNTNDTTVVSSFPFPVSHQEMVDFLVRIYHEHLEVVRSFVAEHPTHTLVEVIINHHDAGTVLGDAFGLDPQHWQHSNKKGDTNTMSAHQARRSYRYRKSEN